VDQIGSEFTEQIFEEDESNVLTKSCCLRRRFSEEDPLDPLWQRLWAVALRIAKLEESMNADSRGKDSDDSEEDYLKELTGESMNEGCKETEVDNCAGQTADEKNDLQKQQWLQAECCVEEWRNVFEYGATGQTYDTGQSYGQYECS